MYFCVKFLIVAIDKSKYLSQTLQNLEESATLKMTKLARQLKAQGHDVISLSIGEPDFDTPNFIKEAAKQALDDGYTKYTPVNGLLELREAICTKLKRDNNLNYSPENIVVSNGAKQSISNLCNALLDPGDEVIIFTPYWVSYFDIVRLAGGTPVQLKADIQQDFKVNATQLAEAITEKTKLIIFSSPCNPTGSVYTKDELAALVEVLDKYDSLFIASDEIYEYINFGEKHTSLAEFESVKDQVITINGMSKGYAMTGWRIGYMAAPAWLAKACTKVQGQVTSGATSFGQKAASVALLTGPAASLEMKASYLRRKKLVQTMLGEIPGIKINDPQGAFYIFPDISYYFGKSKGKVRLENANDFAEMLLNDAHVAVVSGSAFGNDDCFRLSYAAADEVLVEALTRIKHFLSSLS